MGLGNLLSKLLARLIQGKGYGVDELARRLGMSAADLRAVAPVYREFAIAKRDGGRRKILAPANNLKDLQRRILRRLLARLKCHPAVHGFERGKSIVSNARCHVGKAVVLRFDLKDFFPSTTAARVHRYFRKIGWNRDASKLLVRLCTHEGGLPQGAPTSPRLSNLVNYRLDARLAGLAARPRLRNPRTGRLAPAQARATYTRYADDLTLSFATDDPKLIRNLIIQVKYLVGSEGYQLHLHKKLQIRRRHDRQLVTGLVVNESVNLPRARRRWLRAVEHRLARGQEATLTPAQVAAWRALAAMVARQRMSTS
ncbi:MAG TPA: reverse transcriptase family protein [Gemmataceae bacterium]|jgi:retron-type reverse transcriptase|nr:reverse transcriptase family protein [Gemmataceae bacterium]